MERSLPELVHWAAELIRQHSAADNATVIREMQAAGLTEAAARELVAFVPMAFCHAMFPDRQEIFEGHYDLYDPNADKWQRGLPLAEQPIYQEALRLATDWRSQRVANDQFLAVAGRSAEFRAINDLLHGGSRLEDIRCTAPVVLGGAMREASKPKRPWWRLW